MYIWVTYIINFNHHFSLPPTAGTYTPSEHCSQCLLPSYPASFLLGTSYVDCRACTHSPLPLHQVLYCINQIFLFPGVVLRSLPSSSLIADLCTLCPSSAYAESMHCTSLPLPPLGLKIPCLPVNILWKSPSSFQSECLYKTVHRCFVLIFQQQSENKTYFECEGDSSEQH